MSTKTALTQSIITAAIVALISMVAFFSYTIARAEEATDAPPAEIAIVEEVVVEEPAPVVEEAPVVVEEVVAPAEETPVEVPTETPPVEEEVPVAPTEDPAPVTASVISAFNPELTTEKADYHPGETATIFGKFFNAVTTYVLKIFGSDEEGSNYTESVQEITTDDSGSLTTTYLLDNVYRPFYEVIVEAITGEEVAWTMFRDAAVDAYDQCANDDGDGFNANPGDCDWIFGAINGNNSNYDEGDSTVQRLSLDGFAPGTQHTVTLQYGTTKQGKHAYDFLTTWNDSESWITLADRCDGITGCTTAAETTFPIPNDTNGSGQFQGTVGARDFTMRGGTITAASAPTLSGSYAGDSETSITITFTVPSTGPLCVTTGNGRNQTTTCGVVLWFGAHIADSDQWEPFNGTTGATTINGAPYHVAITALDGSSIGNRDNQMQADAIVVPQGTISGVKFNDLNGNGTNDAEPALANWTITLNPGAAVTQTDVNGIYTFADLADGVYTVCETQQAGWLQTFPATDPGNCAGGNGYSVTITNGVNVPLGSLDFGNTNTGHIIVDKVTVPASDPQSFSFDAVGGSYADFALTDASAVNDQTLVAGQYSVSETVPAGWVQTSAVCVSSIGDTETPGSLELDGGETITCTFTNTKQGKILIDKVTDPSGSAQSFEFNPSWSAQNFNLTDAAALADSGFLVPGTYSVSETVPTGWVQTSATCSDGSTVNNIQLAAGETVTCTFTNTQNGTIIVDKVTLPAQDPQSFSFTTTGAGYTGFSLTDSAQPNSQSVVPGAYSVSETVPSGWDLTSATCDGEGNTPASINLAAGETVTCTFTNTKQGTIVIVKDVIGNPDPTDFTFQNNFGNSHPVSFMLDEDNDVTLPASRSFAVLPGEYAVSEDALTGWQMESATCDQGETVGSIDVAPGETVTCTFVNEELISITLIKNTIGGNGAFDFTLTGPGLPSSHQLLTNAGTASQTWTGLDQDDTFSIAETVPVGWDLTSAVCTGGETPASITPEPGEDVTCTFTNTKTPTLTLVKTVINDNGGGATTADFQGKIDEADVEWESAELVTIGAHSASETTLTGYTAGDWGGDCAADGSITLVAGQDATCTITNNDIAPVLHLRKIVTNDNGGTATLADFTLTANGTGANDLSGTSPVDSGAGLLADTWALSETSPAGYSASAWSCVGGTQDGSNITVGIGGEATCTITNNDIQPKLTVIKHVINDDGGTADASDFSLIVNFATNPVPAGQFPGSETGTVVMLDAGSYGVGESVVSGYTPDLTDPGCVGTIAIGEEKTCTVINDDIAPKLTVTKTVVNDNGGTKVVSDFPLFVNGNGVTSGVQNTLSANVLYTATETTQTGYAPSAWGGDCAADGTITLLPGDVKTCTITNDDIAPKLTLVKNLINDNGGAATLASFTLTADGTASNDITGTSPVVSGGTLQSDTFALSETNLPGYIASPWVCVGGTQVGSNITVGIGQEATCTITNNDTPGHFTGGGSVFPTLAQGAVLSAITSKSPTKDTRVTHGFTLHCDKDRLPNRLQVNWGPARNEQKFHLLTLSTSVCTDNSAIDPQQPNADFDTIEGTGVGRFNNIDGATIWFKFDDAGEPGKNDRVWMQIWDAFGVKVLDTGNNGQTGLNLNVGNQQAHQDN